MHLCYTLLRQNLTDYFLTADTCVIQRAINGQTLPDIRDWLNSIVSAIRSFLNFSRIWLKSKLILNYTQEVPVVNMKLILPSDWLSERNRPLWSHTTKNCVERNEQRSLFSDSVGNGIANNLYRQKLFDQDGRKLASFFFSLRFCGSQLRLSL